MCGQLCNVCHSWQHLQGTRRQAASAALSTIHKACTPAVDAGTRDKPQACSTLPTAENSPSSALAHRRLLDPTFSAGSAACAALWLAPPRKVASLSCCCTCVEAPAAGCSAVPASDRALVSLSLLWLSASARLPAPALWSAVAASRTSVVPSALIAMSALGSGAPATQTALLDTLAVYRSGAWNGRAGTAASQCQRTTRALRTTVINVNVICDMEWTCETISAGGVRYGSEQRRSQ